MDLTGNFFFPRDPEEQASPAKARYGCRRPRPDYTISGN